jgi:hypothetical protein
MSEKRREPRTIRNSETIEPGTLVRVAGGRIVREVLETKVRGHYLRGRLRDTRTGRSVGWEYLDRMVVVDKDGNEVER